MRAISQVVEARQVDTIPSDAGYRQLSGFLEQVATTDDGQLHVRAHRGQTIKGIDQGWNITLSIRRKSS